MRSFIKIFFYIVGSISLVIGFIGVFVPLLPTTPFLLLAAACYVKASPRAYNWLLNNKFLGEYIRDYREGRGIPIKTKILAISLLWITLFISALKVPHIHVRLFLILVGIGVSLHLFIIKTKKTYE